MKFSVIIPAFNATAFLPRCLDSLVRQTVGFEHFEVLVIDDCSTDGTLELARSFMDRLPPLKVLAMPENGGPGHARNHGLATAEGEWILFLDSDDELAPDALQSLKTFIDTQDGRPLDAVGYNWTRIDESASLGGSKRIGRRDGHYLGDRMALIEGYLTHRMDGSVIYTAARREMLARHQVIFARGIHEDVDFIFRVYFHARESAYLDKPLYRKRNHAASITHNVSERHIDGYFRAWRAIGDFLASTDCSPEQREEWRKSYRYGSVGVVATRVREVVRHSQDPLRTLQLFQEVHRQARSLQESGMLSYTCTEEKTLYFNIAHIFMHTMNRTDLAESEKSAEVAAQLKAFEGKSWSCVDLHHSLFLRSNQVRTCCKRFFVDGEMRGDVVLFDVEQKGAVSREQILDAKRDLHQKLNSGVSCACDGCPFLEFKDWGPLNELDVHYLSLEHHSVCNLQCTYCSDEYYGGKSAVYDVKGTIDALVDAGVLNHCNIVVWGGGEPIIGKDFDYILNRLATKLPSAQQRILTNSVKKSAAVSELLAANKAQVVTSIDAGTDDTFATIRGGRRLQDVCKTLRQYADVNSDKVTVKYIFTEGNDSMGEVRAFVEQMAKSGLLCCNFQISGDFKNEHISRDTAKAMIVMFGLLRKAGAQVVYFDELLRHRLGKVIDISDLKQVEELHADVGVEFVATPARYPEIIVWGAGQQAKYLVNECAFFKHSRLVNFVDATPAKIGTRYLGADVRDPSTLRETELPVIIAAVQGYPLILQQYRELGLAEDRIVNDLII